MRKFVLSLLGLGLAVAPVIIGAQSASAALVPCPTCAALDAAGGHESGFSFSLDRTGDQWTFLIDVYNQEPVPAIATIGNRPPITIPAAVHNAAGRRISGHVQFQVPAIRVLLAQVIYVKLVTVQGKVLISGDGPAGTKPRLLSCDCAPQSAPPPTTPTPAPVTAPPVSVVRGGPAPTPAPGPTRTPTVTGTLPATGAPTVGLVLAALVALAIGSLMMAAGRGQGKKTELKV